MMKRSAPVEILIVDDVPANLSLLSELLSFQDYQVYTATNGEEALQKAKELLPDLILLDVSMPIMDGYTTCSHLKSGKLTQNIPIIFLSALDDTRGKIKAFEVGGADYVTKPFHAKEVLKRIQHQLALKAAMDKIQQMHDSVEQLVQERTAHFQAEVQEHRQTQQQLLHLISHDPLTNLPNRGSAINQLGKVLEQVWDNPTTTSTFLLLNCDRFKVVNDSLGCSFGDQLLIAMVERLQKYLSEADFLARMAGDEFILLCEGLQDLTAIMQLANRIQFALNLPFHVCQQKIYLPVSMGIVPITTRYQNVDALLRSADTALSHAKLMGNGCYKVFEEDAQLPSLELV
jgi:diguanylate cyclase (GGDEF)-like protein